MKFSALIVAALIVMLVPVLASGQISPDDRLLQRTEWDGAIVTGPYLEAQFRYQTWDVDGAKQKGWLFGPTFAMSFPDLPELETGARAWIISMKPDDGSNETAIGDIDLWGKYQFLDDPFLLSGGILFTLPTGSKKVVHPWCSGAFNVEIFGALRYYITEVFALMGHTGFRINGDMDLDGGGKWKGETQFELGGGVIYEVLPELDLLGELNFATEAYDDMKAATELTAGADYAFTEAFSGRGGIGIGLTDGAPSFELILGGSALF